MARVDVAIIWVTAIAVVALMLTMVGAILLGVFFRYVLDSALPWPEELARFALVWLTMLGAGLVVRYGGHIAVRFVADRLEGWPRRIVDGIGYALVVLFLSLLLWFGADMTERAGRQRSAALEWSMSVPNLAMPVGAAFMLYHMGMVVFRREDTGVTPPPLPFESPREDGS